MPSADNPILPDSKLGEIASRRPEALEVFERHGIDFCCRGDRTLAEAADSRLKELLAELESLEGGGEQTRWDQASIPDLLDHIVDKHHRFTAEAIEKLPPMLDAVSEAHGEKHPEMRGIREVARELLHELDAHMQKEEQVLFPMIRALYGAPKAGQPVSTPGCASSFGPDGPMQVMEMEHLLAGGKLEHIRKLTGGFDLPGDACDTLRSLFTWLQRLERDLHEHIHLENNVLHTRVRADFAATT